MNSPRIVWFRRDLRLHDQQALIAVAEKGPVIPVYILDDESPLVRSMGEASRWWLHTSLKELEKSLQAKGSQLILRKGRCDQVLQQLAAETGAREVHALHHYEPWWLGVEQAVEQVLDLRLHHGNYLTPPGSVTTGSGTLYKIFTPFWRALNERMPPMHPSPAPDALMSPEQWPHSDDIEDWRLQPSAPDWAAGMRAFWQPGESGAMQRLEDFVDQAPEYDFQRNLPGRVGSSMLSPHLHFGEISPAHIWHKVSDAGGSVDVFLKELGWRDYAQNVILQLPDYAGKPARSQFDAFPWRSCQEDLRAWQQGQTGYPIVDAGMRQLWTTGWMHNRVRMIAASFLIKHLLIDWREGDRWFWDTLVDADFGNNAVNWQWSAGSGVDANMFVRIMAPLSQSEKFDAASYIREWVPELARLSDRDIHDPSDAVRPRNYPAKIVEHKAARERALQAYSSVKGA